jgi:hypothetical protein
VSARAIVIDTIGISVTEADGTAGAIYQTTGHGTRAIAELDCTRWAACHAGAVRTGLPAATAGGTTVTGAGAIGVGGTTDRLWITPTVAVVVQTRVMGGITGALLCRWRIGAKDRVAEVGGAAVIGQGQTGKQSGQGCATQNASNAPQSLTPRGRGRQGFGDLIKNVRFHLACFLSC